MKPVSSVAALKELFARARPTGIVRVHPETSAETRAAFDEARRVEETFPGLAVWLLPLGADDEEAEERCAKLLRAHGIDDVLLLPVWWIVWNGRISAVYRARKAIVRDLIGLVGGREPLEAILDWISERMRVERGTGRFERPPRRDRAGTRSRADGADPGPAVAAMPDGSDPHRVLGIPPGSPPEVVRRSYRRLCARYHPDKVAHRGAAAQEEAHRKMVEINLAYEALRKG